jgi:hypothetical protein
MELTTTSLEQAFSFVWVSSVCKTGQRVESVGCILDRPDSTERVLLVLDGLDDALAGGRAGREKAGEDPYEEA